MVAEPTWRQLQIGVESDREVTLRPRWETSPSGLECQQGREPREGEGFGQHSLGVFRVRTSGASTHFEAVPQVIEFRISALELRMCCEPGE